MGGILVYEGAERQNIGLQSNDRRRNIATGS